MGPRPWSFPFQTWLSRGAGWRAVYVPGGRAGGRETRKDWCRPSEGEVRNAKRRMMKSTPWPIRSSVEGCSSARVGYGSAVRVHDPSSPPASLRLLRPPATPPNRAWRRQNRGFPARPGRPSTSRTFFVAQPSHCSLAAGARSPGHALRGAGGPAADFARYLRASRPPSLALGLLGTGCATATGGEPGKPAEGQRR